LVFFKDVQNPAFSAPDFPESVANCNSTGRPIIRVDKNLDPPDFKLTKRNLTRKGDGARRDSATPMWWIGPVGEIRSVPGERPQFTTAEKCIRRDVTNCERETCAVDAFLLPLSDYCHGMVKRCDEIVGKLKSSSVLRVAVSIAHHTSVTAHEKRESDDPIGSVLHPWTRT